MNDYVNSLIKEIEFYYCSDKANTIYIGGGTPSLLSIEQLKKIVSAFKLLNLKNIKEFTIEMNPATGNQLYFAELKELGINRISLGVQSFDEKILKRLKRVHNTQDVYKTLKELKRAGFKNISIDLMHGIPWQSIEQWKTTLNKALDLEIQHISTYGLKIEEGTPLAIEYEQNKFSLPPDDLLADMFIATHDILTANGFNHYEFSNYCKPGFEGIHNINYWQNNHYHAFGLSAHGYINGSRYENTINLEQYLATPTENRTTTKVSKSAHVEEAIFLGLRLSSGIDLEYFKNQYTIDFLDTYKNILQKYTEFFIIDQKSVKLNLKGMLVSNIILSEFLE